jgi:hypothetical protein
MDAKKSRQYISVLVPLKGRPRCEIREADRTTTPTGATLINYNGSDGNQYHECLTGGNVTWLATIRFRAKKKKSST